MLNAVSCKSRRVGGLGTPINTVRVTLEIIYSHSLSSDIMADKGDIWSNLENNLNNFFFALFVKSMDAIISTAEEVFVKPQAKIKVRRTRMTVGGGKFMEIFNTPLLI